MPTSSLDSPDMSAEALRQQIAAIEAEQDQFRQDVRSEVLRQYFDGPWCLTGTQDVLKDLGLPPISMSFDGNAQILVRITKVDGTPGYDDAMARVTQAFGVTCSDPGIEFQLECVDPSRTNARSEKTDLPARASSR